MKVLVVGSNGQLGSDCMSVVGGKAAVVGVDFPEIDISRESCSRRILDRLRPEVVVNCAAYTAVDACENDPLCWKVNADGPAYLAKWASENDAFLVHVSSDYVFDGKKPFPAAYVETDMPAPASEYGKSKLAGEQAVLESGADAAIVRTAWLYGAKGRNFLKTMLSLALRNPDRQLKVVNDQQGSPSWTRTLALQIAIIAEARSTGLFHATSEGHCTWFELACAFLVDHILRHDLFIGFMQGFRRVVGRHDHDDFLVVDHDDPFLVRDMDILPRRREAIKLPETPNQGYSSLRSNR